MPLYKGSFNWYGYTFDLYTTAKSKERAFNNLISRLAKKVQLPRRVVLNKVNSFDSYEIEEIDNE